MARVPLSALGSAAAEPFLFLCLDKQENRMPSTDIKQQTAKIAVSGAANTAVCGAEAKPAIIATRKRCEAEGVGLSHYVLMDRKAVR